MTSYQAYEGAPLAEQQQARLVGPPVGKDCTTGEYMLLFTRVDGRSTDHYFGGYGNNCRYPTEVQLQPGDHQIGVFYSNLSSPTYSSFCFHAEAGHTYKAVRKVDGYKVDFVALTSQADPAIAGSKDVVAGACNP